MVAKINLHAGANGVDHARDFFNYMWEAASEFTQADVDEALRARRMAVNEFEFQEFVKV